MSTTTSSRRLTLMASAALLMATVVIRDTNCSTTTSSHQPTRDNASSRLTLALLMPFDGSFGFETNAAAATIAASDAQTAGLLKDFDIRSVTRDRQIPPRMPLTLHSSSPIFMTLS